jgi:hypothetical protein
MTEALTQIRMSRHLSSDEKTVLYFEYSSGVRFVHAIVPTPTIVPGWSLVAVFRV